MTNYDYRLVAADMDGTLLNSDSQISGYTLDTLKRAISEGVLFVPSSGRPMAAMEYTASLFEQDLPFIIFNGAMAVTSRTKKVMYCAPLDNEDALKVLEIARQRKIAAVLWGEQTLYATEITERVLNYRKMSGKQINVLDEMKLPENIKAIKIIWFDDPEKIKLYHHEMAQYFSPGLNVHPSQPSFLEFVDKRASKAAALEKIGGLYGVKREQMIALGDGYNDLSMLKYAGLGVAMANAPQEIKDYCDFVTASNNEDGVAKVINKFIFKEGN